MQPTRSSDPSDKAVSRGQEAMLDHRGYRDDDFPVARLVLDAAHDPALGLDRSVCLRDVAVAVRYAAGHIRTMSKDQACGDMADFIEREFGDEG